MTAIISGAPFLPARSLQPQRTPTDILVQFAREPELVRHHEPRTKCNLILCCCAVQLRSWLSSESCRLAPTTPLRCGDPQHPCFGCSAQSVL